MSNEPKLRLYNTLTRTKEDFAPIDPADVRMYVCGPTVYDFAHIGNARPVIVFDVLYRLLKHLYPGKGMASDGSRVTYVRNITDVDDKINARALREFPDLPLNEAIRNVTEKTANQFHADVKALGCLEPTHEPRATGHIEGMVEMIQTLLDRDHAYIATGAEGREVLFDVRSMADYGALSNRKLEDQQAGARIEVKDHKKNPGDFVLWKESSANEPGWGGAFTVDGQTSTIHGRPGWHIECSVMSKAHLGEKFDIHGGGLDLIFPHHENEIAQSRCAHGNDAMANIWMHNGYLQVEGRKMSKSEGNFVTIHDLLHTEKFGGRKWPGEVLRLAMLMTHYREPIDFSVKRLEEAYRHWRNLSAYQDRYGAVQAVMPDWGFDALDDLDLYHVLIDGFKRLHQQVTDAVPEVLGFMKLIGFTFAGEAPEMSEAEIERLIEARRQALLNKNYENADSLRALLQENGIQLKDGKDPETGERVTTWEVKR